MFVMGICAACRIGGKLQESQVKNIQYEKPYGRRLPLAFFEIASEKYLCVNRLAVVLECEINWRYYVREFSGIEYRKIESY